MELENIVLKVHLLKKYVMVGNIVEVVNWLSLQEIAKQDTIAFLVQLHLDLLMELLEIYVHLVIIALKVALALFLAHLGNLQLRLII